MTVDVLHKTRGWRGLFTLSSRTGGTVDFLFAGAASAVGALFAFIANVIIARDLGVSGYGRYVTMISAAMVIAGAATYGVGPLLTRELGACAPGDRQAIVNTLGAWGTRLVLVLAMVGGIAIVLWLTWIRGAPSSGWFERAGAALIVPLYAGVILIGSALAGVHKVGASQIVGVTARNGVLLVGAAALLLASQHSVVAVIGLQVVAILSALVLGAAWSGKGFTLGGLWTAFSDRTSRASGDVRAAWRNASRNFFAISLATLVLFRLDVVIVGALAGTDQAGIFGASARIAQFAQLVGLVWIAWLRPRMARSAALADLRRTWKLGTLSMVGAGGMTLLAVAAGWMLAPFLASMLGTGFSRAVWPIRWLLLSWLPWALSIPLYVHLSMSGQERLTSAILWMQVLVLAMCTPLILKYGAAGGAYAWLISSIVGAVAMMSAGIAVLKRSTACRI